ncbi:uncharacterized protein LOC117641236 [Thrips palmi]|uniref:Uncharacterized protein LOC117641236 n=1 Tax=Thrips palmi TaxID=161013 RepID=A0A6P8YK13_THRPL|nr:uncharacterized protein LOC117641236 [Thrips palmi]
MFNLDKITCPVCTVRFPLAHLQTHMRVAHTRKIYSRFICKSGCGRPFSTFDALYKHLSRCSVDGISSDTLESDESKDSCESAEASGESELAAGAQGSEESNFDGKAIESNVLGNAEFASTIKSFSDEFVARLYRKSSLPRNHIQGIVEDVMCLLSKCCDYLKPQVVQTLNDFSGTQNNLNEISKSFDLVKNCMLHLSTDYKRNLYFARCGSLILPVPHEVGSTNESKRTRGGTVFKKLYHYVHSVPLRAVLKCILELPDAFSSVQSHIASLESNDKTIDNFMQCPLWKSKKSGYSADDIVLPLFVFIDDCQYNNALGSHSKSLGACYTSLPFLPEECQSTLDNIILALLYKSCYRKMFGDDKIFDPLIAELTFLEKEGILVSTEHGLQRVFFVTGLLLGDNKGLNSLLGFTECFTANHCCRFCKSHRNTMHYQSVEDPSTLRTLESYNADLITNDVSLTGLKYESVFNKVPSFHVTSNLAVDSFHDLAEGACHNVLRHLLNHCIPNYFTLDILNDRLNLFDYGPCETNRVPEITEKSLSSDKLKLSGSETLLFIKILGILIGDLVPPNDPYWKLYLKLRELLDICQSKSVSISQPKSLRVIVEEFNTMYVKITGDTLKPKMHNFLHYARVLENCGPIQSMAVARFEAKHKDITVPAHTTSSRVNPTLTFSMRHQLSLCYRFMSKQSILPKVEFGPSELVSVSDLDNFELFDRSLPQLFLDSQLLSLKWVNIKGTLYKPGMVLLVNANEHGPVFGELCYILVHEETVLFVFCYFLNLGYSEPVHAFPVCKSQRWSCIEPSAMYDPHPLFAHSNILGVKYVSLKHRL